MTETTERTERTTRIAVVGARGFIGSWLTSRLRELEYDVVELDLPEIDIRYMDSLLMRDVFKDVDVVYHLAVMPLSVCNANYRECIATNILGTANIMEAAREYGVKRVVYASASSVYGDPQDLPVHETDSKQPVTMYGVSKLASEYIIANYTRNKNFDLTSAVFRFTNVYGPGQRAGLIPSVIQKLIKREPVIISGTGDQTRDFVYVDDVVNILIRAMDSPKYSFISNLGSGQNTSVNEVVRKCAEILGLDMAQLSNLIEYAPFDNDRKDFAADLGMLRNIYGDVKFTCFEDGLTKTIDWWLKQPFPHNFVIRARA